MPEIIGEKQRYDIKEILDYKQDDMPTGQYLLTSRVKNNESLLSIN